MESVGDVKTGLLRKLAKKYVYKPHFTDIYSPDSKGEYSTAAQVVPAAILGGLALGAGGRLVKNLFDMGRPEDEPAGVKLPGRQLDVAEVPVDVDEEEARRLLRQGIAVRPKLAAEVTTRPGGSDMGGALTLGLLGTGSAMGGWYLADKLVDKFRRQAAKQDVGRVRRRIERLLDDDPEEEDEPVYGYMKAAEDAFFTQSPEMQKTALGLSDLWWMLPMGVGGGALINAVAGFQESRRQNPHIAKAKQLKNYLRNRATKRPRVSMVPVLRMKEEEEEEEEERQVAPVEETQALTFEDIQPQPVGGSPAQQARQNPPAPTSNWF